MHPWLGSAAVATRWIGCSIPRGRICTGACWWSWSGVLRTARRLRRARGGANAVEPVASLLADLHPDGEWATHLPLWAPYGGPGWRLVAAVQWGADPEEPRLHAASERLLETAAGRGRAGPPAKLDDPDPQLTGRVLEAMVALGWSRHPRVQEWLAWFEATDGWEDDRHRGRGGARGVSRRVAPDAPGACGRRPRSQPRRFPRQQLHHLRPSESPADRSRRDLRQPGRRRRRLSPTLAATPEEAAGPAGRDGEVVPRVAGSPVASRFPKPGNPPRWITLKATKAVLAYAVEAELPRLFPYPPKRCSLRP